MDESAASVSLQDTDFRKCFNSFPLVCQVDFDIDAK